MASVEKTRFNAHRNTMFSKDLQKLLYFDTRNNVTGPIPTSDFVDTFLPTRHSPTPSSVPHTLSHEEAFVYSNDIVTSLRKLGLSTLEFVDTHTKSNNRIFVMEGLRPSILVYNCGNQEAGTNFEQMEFWIELVSQGDIFDCDGGFIPDTDVCSDIFGRLLSYAAAQMTSGFWTHCFSVVIFTDGARLIRWDRAGAIISERFTITDKFNPLLEFCQRFDQLAPEHRGHDPSVRIPSDQHRREAYNALKPTRETGETEDSFSRRKAEISEDSLVEYLVDDSSGKTRSFIGTSPKKQVMLLRGRSTRGCAVYDIETKQICYMKDTWRIDSSDLMREGDMYAILLKKGVHGVAKVVAHGDVVFSCFRPNRRCETGSDTTQTFLLDDNANLHNTQTNRLCNQKWASNSSRSMQGYVHYRLVLDTVGRDLSSFKSSKEALQALIDALTAHGEAYSKAGILHRDISPGNIIITENGRGILIDWDFAHHVCETPPKGFVGTWNFMSGALLRDPRKKIHAYSDDLESFLHVAAYLFLRFSPSNWGRDKIRNHSKRVYEAFDRETEDGVVVNKGGVMKSNDLGLCMYIAGLEFTGRKELAPALREISSMFMYVYIHPGYLGMTEEVLRIKRGFLDRYCDGGESFKSKLIKALERADEWQDNAAVPVDVPPTVSEFESFQRKFDKMESQELNQSPDKPPEGQSDTIDVDHTCKRKGVSRVGRQSRRRHRVC